MADQIALDPELADLHDAVARCVRTFGPLHTALVLYGVATHLEKEGDRIIGEQSDSIVDQLSEKPHG